MFANAARGVVAGAIGTLVLNVATYLGVTVRGRPTSQVPMKAAGRVTDAAGVDLGSGEQAKHRRSGLGALFGHATGLGIGAAYGSSAPGCPPSRSLSPRSPSAHRPWRRATSPRPQPEPPTRGDKESRRGWQMRFPIWHTASSVAAFGRLSTSAE